MKVLCVEWSGGILVLYYKMNITHFLVMSNGLNFDFSSPITSVQSVSAIPLSAIPSFIPTDIKAQSRLEKCEVNFKFKDEGYTLVNILKQYLEKMPEVEFVGRRQHNKVDDEFNLRIKLDREWVENTHQTVELAMIDCLRRAARQAINDALALRNSIPDITIRIVNYNDNLPPQLHQSQPHQSQSQPHFPPQLFDTSDFSF
jgi:DNA-directed RNA polymerase subunit L